MANFVIYLSHVFPSYWTLVGWGEATCICACPLTTRGLARGDWSTSSLIAQQSAWASAVLLGGSPPNLTVYGRGLLGVVGRMPSPSLLSPWHLLDNVASFEKLEMNNSTETSHLESTCPPPVLLCCRDENMHRMRRSASSQAGQVA